jgi:HEAT repeat protein
MKTIPGARLAILLGFFSASLTVIAAPWEPRDPKLKSAYTRLRFERLLPPEAVQYIAETLQDEERAVTRLVTLAGDERQEVRTLVAMLLGELGEPDGGDGLWLLLQDRSETVRITAAGAMIRLTGFTPVPSNVTGLRHADPAIRALTAGTLAKMGDKSAESALIDVLDDDDEQVRMEATRALARCGSEASIPSVISKLHDPSVLVRTAAATTLGISTNPSVIPALLDATKDPDWHVRARAIQSLAQVIQRDPSKIAQVTDVFISKLQEDEFALVRDRAADALAFVGDDRSIDALVRAVVSENRDARFHAARALVTGKSVKALPLLAPYAKHEDPEVRLKVVEVYGAIGGAEQLDTVVEAVEDPDPNVRLAAVQALQRLQQRGGAPALREKISDPNPHVRAASARAIGNLKDQEAVPQLIALLRDPNGFVRGAAAEALGKIGDRSAVAPLLTVLAGEETQTAAALDQSLVIGTDPGLLPEMLRQKRIEEKIQVVQALGALRSPEAVDPIVEHGLKAEDAGLRAVSAVELGRIGDPRAVNPLQEAVRGYYSAAVPTTEIEEGVIAGTIPENVRLMKEREARVRASVAWALGELSDPATIETLTKAANDENSLVRDAAVEALAKINERLERQAARNPKPTPVTLAP